MACDQNLDRFIFNTQSHLCELQTSIDCTPIDHTIVIYMDDFLLTTQ
jgi:hypothetical protein